MSFKVQVKVIRSKIMVWRERFCHKEYTCGIWKPCLSPFISYDQGWSFWKVGQTSRSRSLGKKIWNDMKGLVTRITYVNYESPSSSGLKVMAMVNVFLKSRSNFKVKVTRSKIMVHCMMWKVLSQGIHMWNMKALYLTVHKLWPRLKSLKRMSNFKVKVTRSKIMVHCMMWKVLSQGIHMWNMKALCLTVHKLWPWLKFLKSRSNFKVKVTRSNIMVWCERSCHKKYTCEIWKSYLV